MITVLHKLHNGSKTRLSEDSVCTPLYAPLYTVRHILHVQHRDLPGLGPRHPSWLPQLCRLHNLQSPPKFNAFSVQATCAHATGLASTCMYTVCKVLATQECTCDCIVCGCCPCLLLMLLPYTCVSTFSPAYTRPGSNLASATPGYYRC
jgi:hypothetical protein